MTQLTDRDLESMFIEYFDDVNPPIKFGCLEYLPSDVLKSVDPIAYREEFNCYINFRMDELIFEHSDGSYHDEPEDEEDDENDGVSE